MRCLLLVLIASLGATESTPIVASVPASQAVVPEAALAKVRSGRSLLVTGSSRSVLAEGLRSLASEPGYAVAVASSFSPPGKGVGAILTRPAATRLRADSAVEALASATKRLGPGLDLAAIELAPEALPDGRRVETPIRQYTANMEIRLTSARMAGSYTENLQAIATMGGPNGTPVSVSLPIELPNVNILHLDTNASVPAGSSMSGDGGGYRLSPRDPRQAMNDVIGGMAAVATAAPRTRTFFMTLPLQQHGNLQRNWYNQRLRAWCAENRQPLLDVAEILATGPDGQVNMDGEGPCLAEAWRGSEALQPINAEAGRRIARSWWWLAARLNGWDGTTPPSAQASADIQN